MFEDPERYPREDETDPEGTSIAEDSPQGGGKGGIGGQGREGTGAQEASPPIGEEAEPGRTQHRHLPTTSACRRTKSTAKTASSIFRASGG
jgi:hypothetical protein